MTPGQRLRVVVSWLIQALIAVTFVAIGLGKFNSPNWTRRFERWGYPAGAPEVVGVVELVLGTLALVPRLSAYAALALGTVMIGAMATHARAGEPWWRPLPHFVVLTLLAALRWRDRWKP